jgi:hypothetical protein
MLRANHYGEGACYTNHRDRKWISANILLNCCEIFAPTSRIRYLDKIASDFADSNRREELSRLSWSLEPPLSDAIRISICFENFFKAELLLRGYVIHKIDKKGLPLQFGHLAQDQFSRPIKLSEIKQAEKLRWKRKNDYIFRSLTIRTIEYSSFFRQSGYRAPLKLPRKLFESLEPINQKRNELHYFAGDISYYNHEVIEQLKCIRHCFNTYIVNRCNQLCDELNYPENRRAKRV